MIAFAPSEAFSTWPPSAIVESVALRTGALRIKVVPAFVSEAPSFEGLGLPPVGMLPQDAFLGDRPPLLADYLSDEVSAAVMVPATQKTIAIVGLELQNVG